MYQRTTIFFYNDNTFTVVSIRDNGAYRMDYYVEILTRAGRPKEPLLSITDSNSKTSKATKSNPFNIISDTKLYKLTHALMQRMMNRII